MYALTIPQERKPVKSAPYQRNSDILALADLCLEKHNIAWARYVATGDVGAFNEAQALWQDRADLLGEVGRGI